MAATFETCLPGASFAWLAAGILAQGNVLVRKNESCNGQEAHIYSSDIIIMASRGDVSRPETSAAAQKWNAEQVAEYLARWQVEEAVQQAVNSAIRLRAADPVLHVAGFLEARGRVQEDAQQQAAAAAVAAAASSSTAAPRREG